MKLASLAVLAGCGTSPPQWFPDAGSCVAYVVPGDFDFTSPVISFKEKVMGVLNNNCGSNLCHGNPSSPQGELFLGDQGLQGADSDMVYAALVGVASIDNPGMSYVVKGDAQRSFLMHKIDGDQCQFDAMCTTGDCQTSMPMMGTLMTQDERDTIRRWIAQGAANN